jgi:dihydrofolate reductase
MLHIIVATTNKNGIGFLNKIPWNIPADLEAFKSVTTKFNSNSVIMGRKTWDSLPTKPLPGRTNIVLTKDSDKLNQYDVITANNFEHLESEIIKAGTLNNWIIGGEALYKHFINKPISYLYLTRIHNNHKCDTFFPEIPEKMKLKYKSDIIYKNDEVFNYEIWHDPDRFYNITHHNMGYHL